MHGCSCFFRCISRCVPFSRRKPVLPGFTEAAALVVDFGDMAGDDTIRAVLRQAKDARHQGRQVRTVPNCAEDREDSTSAARRGAMTGSWSRQCLNCLEVPQVQFWGRPSDHAQSSSSTRCSRGEERLFLGPARRCRAGRACPQGHGPHNKCNCAGGMTRHVRAA